MNYKLDTMVGNTISKVAQEAKRIAIEKDVIVEFNFNGITCLVDKNSNIEWLVRDYMNAHLMEWKTIGTEYKEKYDTKTCNELKRRKKAQEEKKEQERIEYEKRQAEEKAHLEKRIEGIEIELIKPNIWNEFKEKNTDPYGSATIQYAEYWAKLMQVDIESGLTIKECADTTSHEADVEGITGFMYGMAVNILSQCWKYGEDLRKWHNAKYKHDGEGVVNPAVLTIGS